MDIGKNLLSDAVADLSKASSRLDPIQTLLKQLPIDGAVGFDTQKPLSNIGVPYSLLEDRIRGLPNILSPGQSAITLIATPLTQLTRLRKLASDVRQKVEELEGVLSEALARGGFKSTSWTQIEIGTPDGGMNADFVGRFCTQLLGDTDEILSIYNQLFQIFASRAADFTQAVTRIIQAQQAADTARSKADIAADAAVEDAKTANSFRLATEKTALSTQDDEKFIKKTRDEIIALDGDTRAKKAEADSTLSAASALKKQVEDYAANFQIFQNALDERTASLATGNTNLTKLVQEHTAHIASVAQTIDRAKSMLATATNAGLTAAQERRYADLDKEIKSGGWAVYISFGILFLALSPLAAYVLSNWDKTIHLTGGLLEYAANVLLRGILLLPALLFVGFTTFRYRRLFRLKHEYGFRASLAGAVEGFKTQSPSHGEDIAAVAFYQLGRNPAEAIDGDSDKPGWYEKLAEILNAFGDRFGKKKDPPPATASNTSPS